MSVRKSPFQGVISQDLMFPEYALTTTKLTQIHNIMQNLKMRSGKEHKSLISLPYGEEFSFTQLSVTFAH